MRTISKIINSVAAIMLIGVFAFIAVACGQETTPTQAPEPTASDVSLTLSEDVAVEALSTAPDFTLPAANKGTEISLAQFRDDKPVVIVFYRAYW